MDSDGLPIVGSGVDYSKVDPLNQKRTLTFLNHFLIRTTSFLNHFSSVCDEKLENLLIRIQRLEASMCILEAKLASIPGLDDITANAESSEPTENAQTEIGSSESTAPQPQPGAVPSAQPPVEQQVQEEQKPKMTVSQDPRFAKYFKMINMGVPPGAVQLKMTAEGVDPSILSNPDAEAPPGAPAVTSEDESDQSAGSDFSD
ncbi:WASH complex subunit 3 [Trichonephila inaurata madagascariensis]|uniref:WASH complex subunit 3 n=1 Tax=Trichonephila inaurata madagascariensis TaxID=2747483 RepID=A0A8X6YXB9_9ARAC|nr:WASH complex subunit 3 [Trichonephila inaurata madagascariensis]